MKVFADYAFEMSGQALGEKNLEELGSWVCSRETCLQSILTWYHWCFLTMDDPRE